MKLSVLLGVASVLLNFTAGQAPISDGAQSNDIKIPTINTQADLDAYIKEANKAVKVLKNTKEDSRFLWQYLVYKLVAGLYTNGEANLSCSACKVGISGISTLTSVSFLRSTIVSAIGKICTAANAKPSSVCQGLAHSVGQSLVDVLTKASLDETTKQAVCYAVGNVCPVPNIKVKELDMPKRVNYKPANSTSGRYKYVLQISDLHYDADYKVGSEADCKKPLCCQADSNSDEKDPKKIKRSAKEWGDYNCDVNYKLLDSLLGSTKSTGSAISKDGYDMVIFSGDVPAHDLWKEAVERAKSTERHSFKVMDKYLYNNKTMIYPVIGNHESVPLNQFPLKGTSEAKNFYLYNFMADEWKKWLPASTHQTLRESGFYSYNHHKNLKMIVLNNNVHYPLNFHLILDFYNPDPNGMFTWLIKELQDAETNGQRVYISSHIPPGSKDIYAHWSAQFYKIVQRYSHVIAAQFYGHEHDDMFEVFYSSSTKTKDTVISNAYLAPSMTTFNGQNPGYRVYKVDADTYEIVDYFQYYADMKQAKAWDIDGPAWTGLYWARSFYNKDYRGNYLDAKFWHEAAEKLSKDQAMFDQFYSYRNKNGRTQPKCDAKCRKNMICTLQAGLSADNCAEYVLE